MVGGVGDIIFGAAQKYGVDPNALHTIAKLESSLNPGAKNPHSSARGLFQFIDSTAKDYGLVDRYDPTQSSDAAARLARDNASSLRGVLGRDPSVGELYLAHQQGAGGARKLLSNPTARAVDVVGADAVRLNGGNANMSAQEFANLWINKANSVSGGGGNTTVQGGLSITPGQGQDTMAESQTGLLGKARQPGGLLSDTGFLSPDRRDRLILAMQGMTMNPNQGLQQAALAGIQGRAKDRSTKEQRNKTGEFLRTRGREDLAAAVESGAIPAQAAVQEALKGPAAPQKGVNIEGRLVNPITGEVIADFSQDESVTQVRGSDLIEKFGVQPGTVDPNALFNVKPDGSISRIGGGGTTFNMPGQPQIGTIPSGQQLIKDPETGNFRLENIPGGAADAAAAALAEKALTNTTTGQSVVSEQVDTATKLLKRDGVLDLPEAGIIGSALANFAGVGVNQEAVDLKNTLTSLRGGVAFRTLTNMREASKTGGALGGVSAPELDMLESALGSLKQSTSAPLLSKNLATVKRIMGKIENDPIARAYIDSPDAATPAPAGSGGFTIKRRID